MSKPTADIGKNKVAKDTHAEHCDVNIAKTLPKLALPELPFMLHVLFFRLYILRETTNPNNAENIKYNTKFGIDWERISSNQKK